MSFGYSVGDFVALGQLAWKVYKACRDAPEEFKNLTQEVLSLHAVLKEVEETFSDATLSAAQRSRLRIIGDGCRGVLEDLQGILDRYNSLGTQTRRTWDRLGWGSKDIAELRSRLISNTVLLTTFINTSQVVVQKRLDLFLQEFRDGKREGSIVSTQTVNSLSIDERQAWRTIRKELEDIGICVAAFDANKEFIMNWFKSAIKTGAFEEQAAEDGSDGMLSQDDESQSLEDLGHETVWSQPLENQRQDTGLTSTSPNLQALNLSPGAKTQRKRPPRVVRIFGQLFRHDLFTAVKYEDETKILLLLQKGVDINMKSFYGGASPLHYAVLVRSEVMVRFLLQHGAKVDAKNSDKETALHYAAWGGAEMIARLLFENGANVNGENRDGYTKLHAAAAQGHQTLAQLLLENGAEIGERNRQGFTALHLAAERGREMVVQLLLENGAEIGEKNWQGSTALHLAAENGYKTIVQLLLENGAKSMEKSVNGWTALHAAALNGHETVVQLLLENGAKVNERDDNGETTLKLAMNSYSKTAFKLRDGGGTK